MKQAPVALYCAAINFEIKGLKKKVNHISKKKRKMYIFLIQLYYFFLFALVEKNVI